MKRLLKDNKFVIATFFCAATIVLIVFVAIGLSPFGNRQIMVIDSWHQYFPALVSLHRKIRSGESLFYSWLSGGGTNYLTFIGYYAMSPLNLLSLLFPESMLQEFFWMATLVKISLAGAFFSYYLKKVFNKDDLSIVVFGLTYSFCGFLTGYYWNIMWLDVVCMLPLLMIGLHGLVESSKYRLYVIVLALCMISNFYIGIFICEFVAIYFFVLYFDKNEGFSLKNFLLKLRDIVVYSSLALMMSAITFLPIIYGMTKAYGQSSANPTQLETYHAVLDLVNNMLINVTPTIIDGLPNISSSMFVFFLLVLFFFTKQISTRKKVIYGLLVFFLLMSLNINYLNFVWHGLHFPNQVPYRFSFLLSFVFITMAYQVYLGMKELDIRLIKWVFISLIAYFVFSEKLYSDLFDFKVFYFAMVMIILYAGLSALYIHNKVNAELYVAILLCFILFESITTMNNAAEATSTTGRDEYNVEYDTIKEAFDFISADDEGVSRIEMAPRYSTNDALAYGYMGLVQFASTANSKFAAYTQFMGMPSDHGSNTIAFEPNTPGLNGLFAIGYMISKYDHIPMPNEAYEEVFRQGNVAVLKNKYALPFMYQVKEEIIDLSNEIISPFERQLRFYNLATGQSRQFFAPIPIHEESYQNMTLVSREGARNSYQNIDTTQTAVATISYLINQTDQYYLYMLDQTPTANLTVGDVTRTIKTPRGMVVDLGVLEPGTPVTISLEVMAAESGYFDLEIVSFNELMFSEIANELNEQAVTLDVFEETKIQGHITSEQGGLIYTSIPYEEGWRVKVNGAKVEPWNYRSAVIAIPIEAGENMIELTYRPKGFVAGLILTLLSVLVFVLMPKGIKTYDNMRRKKGREAKSNG